MFWLTLFAPLVESGALKEKVPLVLPPARALVCPCLWVHLGWILVYHQNGSILMILNDHVLGYQAYSALLVYQSEKISENLPWRWKSHSSPLWLVHLCDHFGLSCFYFRVFLLTSPPPPNPPNPPKPPPLSPPCPSCFVRSSFLNSRRRSRVYSSRLKNGGKKRWVKMFLEWIHKKRAPQ